MCFHALWTSLGLNAEDELGDDEAVVCPVLGATHSPCDPHVLPVPLPDDEAIDEMPMFTTRMRP